MSDLKRSRFMTGRAWVQNRIVWLLIAGGMAGCRERQAAKQLGAPTVAEPTARRIEGIGRQVRLGKPLFRVGGSDAKGPLAFGRVNGGVIDRQHRVWVADGMTRRIVRVGPARDAVDVVGRSGQGPMEFAQLQILGWSRGRVAVVDQQLARITLIDPGADTGVVSRIRLAWHGRPILTVAGVGDHGERVFVPNPGRRTGPGFDPKGAEWLALPKLQVVAMDATGASTVLFSETQPDFYYFDGHQYLKTPFATTIRPAVFADTVFLVGTLGGDVLMSAIGASHPTAFNVGLTPGVQVTEDLAGTVRRSVEAMPLKERSGYVPMSVVERHGLPRLPFFDWIVVSRNGAVWVRHTEEALAGSSVWDVFTPEGRRLGTITLPAGESVLAVDSARVATIREDVNDAAVVTVYDNPLPRVR